MKLRCVATAPFGFPVVPDVYMIVASSSGSTAMSGNAATSSSPSASANVSAFGM